MAMPFFDATDSDDVNLLHPLARQADPTDYATRAERDVLAAYKEPSGNTWYTCLRGFEVDASNVPDVDECEAELVQALKETIAEIVSWRYLNENRDPGSDGAKREKLGDYEIEYANAPTSMSVTGGYPPNWTHRLARFDTRNHWFQ